MSYSLRWMPSVLKAAGLKVALVDGWQDRGRGDMGRIAGVLCHHTAGAAEGNMPSLGVLVDGRAATGTTPALAGPLAQLGLGRDGTYYVIAAGRCNHAGRGQWNGVATGNTSFIGIEAENTGLGQAWPPVQFEAYWRGVAALLMHEGLDAFCCAGHKEYALPPRRKMDPSFDMEDFRAKVAQVIAGTAPAPAIIPSAEPPPAPGAAPGRPTLRRGATGDLVSQVQQKLALATQNGIFGPETEAALRIFQRNHNLVPDGIVGPKTWAALSA